MKLAALLVVLIVLVIVACAGIGQRSDGPGYRRVQPGIAFDMLRDSPEDLLILDLRQRDEFRGPMGHLRGAHNIPLDQLPLRLLEVSGHRGRTFLVYCRNDDCGAAGMAILMSSGFDGATLIEGGIEAWVGAGYGTVGVRVPNPPAADAVIIEGPMPPASDAPPAVPVADSAEVEAGLPPPAAPQPERGTVYLRLADGSVILPPRRPTDLHLVGRLASGRFFPDGGVHGEGEFCADLRRREAEASPGWLELANGIFYQDETARAPMAPYIHGCTGADGHFHPDARTVSH